MSRYLILAIGWNEQLVYSFYSSECWGVLQGQQYSKEICCGASPPANCWDAIYTVERCCLGQTPLERGPGLVEVLADSVHGVLVGNSKHDRQLKIRTVVPTKGPKHVLMYPAFDFILTKQIDSSDGYEASAWNDVYKVFVPHQGLFLDLGANFGQVSVPVALAFGSRVVAIEAMPFSFRCLTANAMLNGLADELQTLHAAIGPPELQGMGATSVEEHVDLWLPTSPSLGMASFQAKQNASQWQARFTTIDALRLEQVMFIKADLEGGELGALRGAVQTLKRWRPILYLEYHAQDDSLLSWLHFAQYQCYLHRFVIKQYERPEVYVETNLLCVHRGDKNRLDTIASLRQRHGLDRDSLTLGFHLADSHTELQAKRLLHGWFSGELL